MKLNNIYTRTGLMILGLTLSVLGLFIDVRLSIFGLVLWIFSIELYQSVVFREIFNILKNEK